MHVYEIDADLPVEAIASEVEKIAKISPIQAEKALEILAHKNGDEFLVQVLEKIPPIQIAEILTNGHDYTYPSVISIVSTPKQIARILKVGPLFWEHVNKEKAFTIQSDALSLLTSLLLDKNREEQQEALELIAEEETNFLFLALPFIGWRPRAETGHDIEDIDFEPGGIDHLFESIRWAAPEVADRILDFISGGHQLVRFIRDLQASAMENIEISETSRESAANDGFVPFD